MVSNSVNISEISQHLDFIQKMSGPQTLKSNDNINWSNVLDHNQLFHLDHSHHPEMNALVFHTVQQINSKM